MTAVPFLLPQSMPETFSQTSSGAWKFGQAAKEETSWAYSKQNHSVCTPPLVRKVQQVEDIEHLTFFDGLFPCVSAHDKLRN